MIRPASTADVPVIAKLIRDLAEQAQQNGARLELGRKFLGMESGPNGINLTVERAAFIIGEYPPVLVTTEEELRMSKRGFSHGGVPEERYAEIPISGFSLRTGDAIPR